MWRTSLAFCLAIAGVCIAEYPPIPASAASCSQKLCEIGMVCTDTIFGAICVPVKPGQCPPGDCRTILSQKHDCINECQGDYDCKGFDKCCRNCQGCRKCLKMNFDFLCDNVRCGDGKECKLQLVPCIDHDCKPVPICVDKGDKLGLCPAPGPETMDRCTNKCADDSDCFGSEKCCPSSCDGSMCIEPLPHKSCDDTHCHGGAKCREVYDGKLVMPHCLENPPEPPQGAQCLQSNPLLQFFHNSPLSHVNCGRTPERMDCPHGYRCLVSPVDRWAVCCRDKDPDCHPPCPLSTVCLIAGSIATCVPVKTGQCPKTNCPNFPLQHPSCIDECNSDYHCNKNENCCQSCQGCRKCLRTNFDSLCDDVRCGNGKECKLQMVPCTNLDCKPVPICVDEGYKIGLCPAPGPETMDQCTNQCATDSHCFGSKKCCPSSCESSVCTEPLPHKSCDDAHCHEGTKCREVYDGNSVVPRCLENPPEPPQGAQCLHSNPLLQFFDNSPLSHANCGRTPERMDCPHGYRCLVSPVDQWAVCCRDKEPDCHPPCPIGTVCTGTGFGGTCLPFKSGQCPKSTCPIHSIQNTHCYDECKSDYDCYNFEKCCQSCQGCRKCLKTNFDYLCDQVRCGDGKECKLQMVPCIDHDCKPVPICVEKGYSLGLCPTPGPDSKNQCDNQCAADSNCFGSEKCCPSSCGGSMCTEPLPHKSCVDAHCPKGTKCREVYDGTFVVPECLEYPPEPPEGAHCMHSFPLLQFLDNSPLSHVKCGHTSGRMGCPPGYKCVVSPVDQWAVCCRDKEPDCYPPCGPGEECVTTKMQCFVPPCPPSPRCVVRFHHPSVTIGPLK